MSKPIRDRSCGCIVGTAHNMNENIPFWASLGNEVKTIAHTCRKNKLEHTVVKHRQEIKNLFGTVIGYLVWNTSNPRIKQYVEPKDYSTGMSGGFGASDLKLKLQNLYLTEMIESRGGRWSRYIVIDKCKNRHIFSGKDVYCEECNKWHFKGLN